VEEKEIERASEDSQEVIPLDLAHQAGVPQPDVVPELVSDIEMELVQQQKDVSEPPKEKVSSKKRRRKNKKAVETIVKNDQPEVIQEPQDTEDISSQIVVQEPLPEKNQERTFIVIEMEPASKHSEDSPTSNPSHATEDLSLQLAVPEQAVDKFNASEERPELPSMWRRFKKYLTPKHRRQYKTPKHRRQYKHNNIKRERSSSV